MKFIHFGCWNNGICSDTENNGLTRVMKDISANKNGVDFVVVAGDNYYPEKIKGPDGEKLKIFHEEKFKSGVSCLPDIKKYVLSGNHEFDTMVYNSNLVPCISLIKQREAMPDLMHDIEHVYDTNSNTLIVMIDTTVYDFTDQNITESCFEHLYDQSSFSSIANIVEYQTLSVKRLLLKYNIKNFILIGHYPIASIKKTKKVKIEFTTGLLDLYSSLKSKLNGVNLIYLCADTHLYQTGRIEYDGLIIKQFIVGTGGAKLDDCSDMLNAEYSHNNVKVKYEINECIRTFGYLVVDLGDTIEFNFKYIPEMVGGGVDYYGKYQKYKGKYLKLLTTKNNS
jgi:hypothetical protein